MTRRSASRRLVRCCSPARERSPLVGTLSRYLPDTLTTRQDSLGHFRFWRFESFCDRRSSSLRSVELTELQSSKSRGQGCDMFAVAKSSFVVARLNLLISVRFVKGRLMKIGRAHV